MYITLQPDTAISGNSYSDFVSTLTEPLILNNHYVALSEFYFPFDFSVQCGYISFSIPINFIEENYSIEKDDSVRLNLTNLFDNFREKIMEILLFTVKDKTHDQLYAELDYNKKMIIQYLSDSNNIFSAKCKSIFTLFNTLKSSFYYALAKPNNIDFITQIINQIDAAVDENFIFKSIDQPIFFTMKSESKINIPYFIHDNELLNCFDIISSYSKFFKLKAGKIEFLTKKIVQNFCIYTDIITENQSLNKNQQILKIVKPEGEFGDFVEKYFDRPHYLQCNKTFINRIRIQILDNNSNIVHFNSPGLIIKLHFKKNK
jgi:hypothetical protein